MAYHLHHTVNFYNCLNERLKVELYKKDVVPDDVTELRAISFTVQYPTGSGGLFDTPIVSCEAKLVLYLEASDSASYKDFIVTFPDGWKMIAYNDEQVVFVGFLTPGDGRAEWQDKPYEVTLSAVDGLGLLKGVPLTKDDETRFTGVNLIKDYVLAILNKTGLNLNLRLFSNIVEESMEDRTQNTHADTFNQTGLHARSLLKDPITYYDCYSCLEKILGEYFTVYQHHGKWVILRIGELQTNPGNKIWYTEYNSTGSIVGAEQYLENAAAVGRDRLIHPVEISQFISSNFAVKSAKYTFNYNSWPELPANNKFTRGTEIPFSSGLVFEQDNNGNNTSTQIGTNQDYTIDEWTFGSFNGGSPSDISMLPSLKPAIDIGYRRTSKNFYGVEINQEVIIEKSTGEPQLFQSDGVPVYIGDIVSLSFDYKLSFNFNIPNNDVFRAQAVFVYIKPLAGGSPYWWRDGAGILNRWRQNGAAAEGIYVEYEESSDDKTKVYKSRSLDSLPIPVDGTLYIQLTNVIDAGVPNWVYFKNFSFEYRPFIAGGYLQVKADYTQTSQDANFKDVIDEEVFISDSPRKVIQGALYRENLTTLTTPTWHRYGVIEQRHFKELGELARFNNNYRRMWKMEGQFDGLKFTPSDNQTFIEPLSFHRHFTFPNDPDLSGHYFVLVPPLTLNYSEGRADMNFVEVLQEGSQDGNSTGDSHIPLQYIFE
jgi:hypothetical protein